MVVNPQWEMFKNVVCRSCGQDTTLTGGGFYVNGKDSGAGVHCPKCHSKHRQEPKFFPKGSPNKPLVGRDGTHY